MTGKSTKAASCIVSDKRCLGAGNADPALLEAIHTASVGQDARAGYWGDTHRHNPPLRSSSHTADNWVSNICNRTIARRAESLPGDVRTCSGGTDTCSPATAHDPTAQVG